MAVFLAFLSAVAFGGADFIGGLAARRASAISVVVTSHLVGLGVVVAVAPLWGSDGVVIADFGWGAAAGAAGGIGLAILYHAFASTRFTVAAPAAALMGAAVPVLFGVVIGERPGGVAWIGVALALPAILLISGGGGKGAASAQTASRAVLLGGLAGLLFGVWGIFIAQTGDGSGVWPLVGARLASIPTMVVVALAMGRPLLATGSALRISLTAGAADMAANILLLAALHEPGLLSLVLLISSLYPAGTVILARVVLGERMSRIQVAGLVMAGAGVGLIAVA